MDLTTVEVYVAAALSGDKNLCEVFRSKGDFHSSIAKLVFRLACEVDQVRDLHPFERQAAKAVPFGMIETGYYFEVGKEPDHERKTLHLRANRLCITASRKRCARG